jgi:hypothetical protein
MLLPNLEQFSQHVDSIPSACALLQRLLLERRYESQVGYTHSPAAARRYGDKPVRLIP